MKRIIVLVLAAILMAVSSMGCIDSHYYVISRQFFPADLVEITPYGLVYGRDAGKNWWEGTYQGYPVLIHAVVTNKYVNVEFQYIKEK